MKALKKYLKKRESAINLVLEKQQQSYTPDTFHKLRVEIKMLSALFDLIKNCSKEFKHKKTFKPFKLIFRQAGKIRELQVEESLLEKHFSFNLLKEYKDYLKKGLTGELEKFFSITNSTFSQKLKKKYRKMNLLLTKTSKRKVKRYMAKKRTKIEKLLHQNALKNKQIHSLRKRIKEYLYNQKSLNYGKKNKLVSNKNILPELLGEWHDYQIIINHLQKAIDSGEINPNERDLLKKIKETFTFKSESLFNKINAGLPYKSNFGNA